MRLINCRRGTLGVIGGETGLLGLLFLLMVIPRTNRRINEAADEKEEADKQYDTRHPSVKPMSSSHTCGLTHCSFPENTLRAVRH